MSDTHYSAYDNADHIARNVAEGRHREMIGGMWEELGRLQHDFLIAQGLRPHHRLIDIGCGSLRAGVPLARYLEPAHYYGIDISPELLRAGLEREIAPAGWPTGFRRKISMPRASSTCRPSASSSTTGSPSRSSPTCRSIA